MYPTKEQAELILKEAASCNPGSWENHSRLVALCAEAIARECGMNSKKAFVLGLLHDIGRRFGVKHLGHIYDGYRYMNELGYDEVARVCLTHSFQIQSLDCYIGKIDITEEQVTEVKEKLESIAYDEYDLLIQLCDSLATGEKIVTMNERMADVEKRYGSYPPLKRKRNIELRQYFEHRMEKDLYSVVSILSTHSQA